MYVVHAVSGNENYRKVIKEGLKPPVRSGVKNYSSSSNPNLLYFSVEVNPRDSLAGRYVFVLDEDFIRDTDILLCHTHYGSYAFWKFVNKMGIREADLYEGIDDEFYPNQLISFSDIPRDFIKLVA